jgi:hypothetical protein
VGWVVGPSTLAYVIGSNMSDTELFAIADNVNVNP